jgi:hypothetical protein
MKECDCTKNKKIRPFDTCIYCAHKHAASALALSNFKNKKVLFKFRIISQLVLSRWHLNDSFGNLHSIYENLINSIINDVDYKHDLTNLVEFLWQSKNDEINDSYLNNISNINFKFDPIINGLINLSNTIELLKYENTYLNINYSYAIGQLNLAMWTFQDINQKYANECREIYKNIEINNIDIGRIEFLICLIVKENKIL